MNITTDPNIWAICALVFLLGLLIGVFLTAGGRKKWKTRYNDEVVRRRELERTHQEREKHWTTQEKEWRTRSGSRDADGDGVRDDVDRRPTDDRRA